MKKYLLTMSIDGVNVDAEEIIYSETEPGYWECQDIAHENGCDLWSLEEVKEDYDFLKYDSKEDINKCLNCQKEKCTNCLRFKNGV